jgi:hypothetical protein
MNRYLNTSLSEYVIDINKETMFETKVDESEIKKLEEKIGTGEIPAKPVKLNRHKATKRWMQLHRKLP